MLIIFFFYYHFLLELVWSREDDIKGSYYRPAYLHFIKIGICTDGYPVAWQHRVVGQSTFTPLLPPNALDESSVEAIGSRVIH